MPAATGVAGSVALLVLAVSLANSVSCAMGGSPLAASSFTTR